MSGAKDDPDNVIRVAWGKEDSKKPRGADGGLGHDELRDRWIERYPDMGYSGGDWWAYRTGVWSRVDAVSVEGQIIDVLEGSRDEGVKVTGHLVGSVLRLAKAAVYVPLGAWDADPNVLVCANGALELDTKTLRDHSPDDHATSGVPYDYDPEARAEVFETVLAKALPESVSLVQEFAGYCLTTDTALETALWFVGPRGSGKSTIIEGLTAMLGARHGVLGLAEIESSPFALAKIPGKTLLISTEQPSSYLKSTHIIDALISGETLTIDRKYRDAEEVRPVAKVIWAMNDKPRIGNTTSGIFRRVKIIEFPALENSPDPDVKDEIKKEGAGVLNWALGGLERLSGRGRFVFPAPVLAATAEFEHSNDVPALFIEEECVLGEDQEAPSGMLYNRYVEWCRANNHKPQSSTRLNDDWKRLGFEKRTLDGRKFWRGVGLKGIGS